MESGRQWRCIEAHIVGRRAWERRLNQGMRVLQTSFAVLLLLGTAAFAQTENLLINGSFETPPIEGRLDARHGGAPALREEATSWAHFLSGDETGAVTVGLTNELARTGKQSIYIDFKKAGKMPDALLMTELLPIKASEAYRISLWGRLDSKRPLTLIKSRPLLRVEVEFFEADLDTQIGDTVYRTQQIPGSPRRILFETERWNEYYTEVKSPEGAAFMKVSFLWQATGVDGEADGLIFFDDAFVDGPPGIPLPREESDPASKPAALPVAK